MRTFENTTVTENIRLNDNYCLLTLNSPKTAGSVAPGQFINLYFRDVPRLFPRPFSIAGTDGDNIKIIYKIVGPSTRAIADWVAGQEVNICGPLGNCFQIDDREDIEHVLIAGGAGIAPLLFLRDKMATLHIKPYLLFGMRTKSDHFLTHDGNSHLHLSTDDGSLGFSGNIVDMLKSILPSFSKPVTLYSCGPDKMNRAVAILSRGKGIALQISFERIMACGLGLCQGCTLKLRSSGDEDNFALVCKDGPVFRAEEIKFED